MRKLFKKCAENETFYWAALIKKKLVSVMKNRFGKNNWKLSVFMVKKK